MVAAPVPVVSNHDAEDEKECPVCLEPLSFSFRLPGEKPHIVPDCGHALHEACFTAVYGPPPSQNRSGSFARKSNLGVCGVCRRPMKVTDTDGGKSNKLAALTGMGERNTTSLYPGREGSAAAAALRRTQTPHSQPQKPYDPTEDDPIEHVGSIKSSNSGPGDQSSYIVAPSIQVRPEFSTLTRTNESSQPLTCIVVIELPSRRVSSHVPGPVINDMYRSPSAQDHHGNGFSRHETNASTHSAGRYTYNDGASETMSRRQQSQGYNPRSPSPEHHHPRASVTDTEIDVPYESPPKPSNDSPFKNITEDLRARIIDWKGHPLSGLGSLQMFDLLSVRRDALVREFFVYLFKEAIICVEEEKKRTLGRFLGGGNSNGYEAIGNVIGGAPGKGVLKLKGRIYIRHIKQVTDTSVAGELSLTIDMEDERLESFILIFKDRSSLEAWKANIAGFVAMHHQTSQGAQIGGRSVATPDVEEFGNGTGNASKAMRMLSGSTATTSSSMDHDSLLNGNGSIRSSSTSHGSMGQVAGRMAIHSHNKLSPLGEDDELYSATSPYGSSPTGLVTPHLSSGPSNSLTPISHPPLDLIVAVSIPPPTATPSTAALKNRVIKNTLDFVLSSLGPKDRLSFVTFEVGVGGRVRKTPFLSVGRGQSRARLVSFMNEIGAGRDSTGDEFLVRGAKEEKTDVVTAVNHGLDVVLQRKARNPVSGMLLVSDAADSTRRAQMDLVLARAEAANVPIHSFGYGRSHDPASLWLMSNHTGGTYTFIKDWYNLRDCLAGCVGGLMSIGILYLKLHLKIVDGHRFRIRKVSGGPSAIVASDGRDVDIEVGEVRYGEKKEMLIELELDNTDSQGHVNGRGASGRALNATDQFVQRMGLDSLSLEDSVDFADGMMDRMIDEVPVFEVDGSFFDPAATKHVSRLAHPVLLTITLMPAVGSRPRTPAQGSDPVILRRRMELLASDMITRALVLVSRKNYPQAAKILGETRRILHTVLQSISQTLPPPGQNGNSMRNRKEILTMSAVRALQAVLTDLQVLAEALEDNVDVFAHDQRNFGAQQAMILRDQKSWSGRTPTEKLFWSSDNSIELVSRSTDWVASD
ncbi:Pleckstrin homology domain-containing protein [Phellopilus nigrolimitatus]|nr:Pleckstrin homology domain-containing protein [Phellopilus nigrolimitatus]